jgi:geranylgeranyl reductase family protein
MPDSYDVIVVGAGPGGSATALELARQGRRVLLLDKHEFPRDKTCGDGLSPEAIRILGRLGLPDLAPAHGYRIDAMSVTSPGGTTFHSAIDHDDEPGFVVPRIALDDALRAAAIEAGADFRSQVRVAAIEEQNGVVVGSERGADRRWRGEAMVLAVGANMALLKSLQLLPSRPSVGNAARRYIAGLPCQPHVIQFRFDGVPLPGYGWIFPTSSTSANVGVGLFEHMTLSSYELLERFLNSPAIREELGGEGEYSPTKAYPLRLDFHRSPLRRGRVLLVGEAAGLVNPFSGEGIDYALESGMVAAECLGRNLETGDWSERTLSRYERRLRRRFQRAFELTLWLRRVYMSRALLNALCRACVRWPDLPQLFVDVLQTRQTPLRAFTPRVMLRVLRSLPAFA